MAWTADGLPALDGRVAVITGANSGIGFHTARQLAAHGARVVLACRRPDSGEAAAERIRRDTGGDATFAQLDLGSIASVRHFAGRWNAPLDLLINNAGVMAPPKLASTPDGFELQFGVNHLGHFVLTGLLLQHLEAAKGRVVSVASIAHHGGTEQVLDGNVGEAYHPQRTYSNSKLANLLFALQLHHEINARDLPITSVAAHPGVASTGLVSSRQGMGAKRPGAHVRADVPAADDAVGGGRRAPDPLRRRRGRAGVLQRPDGLPRDPRRRRPGPAVDAGAGRDAGPPAVARQRGPHRLPLDLARELTSLRCGRSAGRRGPATRTRSARAPQDG